MSVDSIARRQKLTGIAAPARAAAVEELTRRQATPVTVVVIDELRAAEQLAEDIAFFRGASAVDEPLDVLIFPESMPDSRDMREAFAASADRLTVLSRLKATRHVGTAGPDGEAETTPAPPTKRTRGRVAAASRPLVVVTTPGALLQEVPALEEFAVRELVLKPGMKQSFQGLLERLRELDYDSEAVCEAPGHYAIRGGIIDVYPVTATQPYRLDFFGDEIEEIRAFDPVTQRSGEPVPEIAIAASPRVKLDPSKTGIADYLSPHTTSS